MIPFPIVIVIIGLVTGIICVPLILGKVGRNPYYGIRIRPAFASEENWYRINKFGGMVLLAASFFILIIGIAGFFIPPSYRDAYSIVAGLLILGIVLGSVAIIKNAFRDA